MNDRFDLIVIGSGSGLEVSSAAAARGLRVAVIDEGPFGGTCLNRGCIPSKMLVHVADVAEAIRHARRLGISARIEAIDWDFIVRRTFEEIDAEAAQIEQANRDAEAITVFRERARFVGHKRLSVGGREIAADTIVIAAGSRPWAPDIDGLDEVGYSTSDDVMRLPAQPRRLAILGGGYVACELAHVFGALGTDVTLVTHGPLLVGREDRQVAERLTEAYRRRFRVITGAEAQRVRRDGDDVVLATDGGEEVAVDALLVATGRSPNTDLLDVTATGVEVDDDGFVRTDPSLETTVPGIWALGDIVGRYQLKHSANLEAAHVAHNVLNPDNRADVDYRAMPHAIFSSPQIGSVGLTEEAARDSDRAFVVTTYDYADTAYGSSVEDHDGFVKVLLDPESGDLLGCHVIGTEAATLVQEAVNVMRFGLPADVIGQSIYIHPALPEVMQRAIGKAKALAEQAAHAHSHEHEHG